MTTRTRWLADVRADVNAARARATTLTEDMQSLRDRAKEQNRSLTDGESQRVERLQKGYDNAIAEEQGFEDEAKGMLMELSQRSENVEDGTVRASVHDAGNERLTGRYQSRAQLEGAALRAVERQGLTGDAADRLDHVIRDADTDPAGLGARYLAAVAAPEYARAFSLILRDPMTAYLRMSAAELESVRTVHDATEARALSLTGASGGFAVPFALDPSIINTGAGSINPLRQIATIKTIAVDEWRGITSAGITAAYAAEATETTDNAPTLVQPTITTEKAQAFIPFSIEVGMDWQSIENELGGLLATAKDDLESTKFTVGSGTNEPFGVITGATTTVNATAAGVFDAEDVYRLTDALPARHQARASYVASGTIINKMAQFETAGGALQFPEVRDGRLLRKPLHENSSMATVTTVGALFLIYGDFSRFVIVDRIGLQVELIPHLVGTNHRPTGQRGLFAFWRNSSKVIDAGAFRVLIGLA